MSLNRSIFSKISIIFFLFSIIIFIHASCITKPDKAVIKKENPIVLLELPKPGTISENEKNRIRLLSKHWFDSALKQRGFSGGMLVAKDGNIIFEEYNGTANIPGTDTITANSSMHIASVSKTFTAMAVLKLWQEGKLNIEEEFSRYFPLFNYPGVTIRNLLNHRSGLPNYNYFMEYLGWDKTQYVSNNDVLNFLVARKTELKNVTNPGTHFNYCNTNYALLALVIEKVSGQTYAEYMKNSFFIPLGMKNSYVFALADTLKAIPSYNWRGGLEPYTFLDQVYGDKNIFSTPADLLLWDRVLSTNIIFTNETLQQAYTAYSNERPGIRNYGLGWRMYLLPNDKKIVYHNGWWHGSNSTFIRLINENATIIVVGNKFTRNVYKAKMLTGIFGDYYNPTEDDESGSAKEAISIKAQLSTSDSILKPSRVESRSSKKKKR